MKIGLDRLLILILSVLLSPAIRADCAEPDPQLIQIRNIAVVASLVAHGELKLTIAALQAPFENLLAKRGVSLDKSIKDNYVHVRAYIDRVEIRSEQLYIVNLSAQYHEQCTTIRTKQEALCTLWEFYEPTKTFTSPSAAREHVLRVVRDAAKGFLAEFDHQEK